MVLCLGACASYQHALDVSLSSLNAARDGFVAWDADHQLRLVEGADTKEAAKAALASYRADRKKVTAALLTAYGALSVAAVKPDGASIAATGAAIGKVFDEMRTLGMGGSP